jgi:hypothetical protein
MFNRYAITAEGFRTLGEDLRPDFAALLRKLMSPFSQSTWTSQEPLIVQVNSVAGVASSMHEIILPHPLPARVHKRIIGRHTLAHPSSDGRTFLVIGKKLAPAVFVRQVQLLTGWKLRLAWFWPN